MKREWILFKPASPSPDACTYALRQPYHARFRQLPDALLHVSQISIDHVEKPSDVLKVGQEITAKIVDFNEDTKKISLSVKAIEIENKKEAEASEAKEAVEEE